MPMAQPIILKKIFNISTHSRKSNRINKKIINENKKQLFKFPIVKYNTIIPFQSNVYFAYINAKIMKIFGKSYMNNIPEKFLDTISDYVQDLVRSRKVKNYPPYNYTKILNMVNKYYEGEKQFAYGINWWLAFDTWRELLEK